MRSEDLLGQLAQIDREMIEHRVRTLFERRTDGDVAGVLEYLAEDFVYHTKGDWTLYPFSRPVRGKAAFQQVVAAINAMYENLGSEIHELVIDGERVALHRTSQMRNRGTGSVHAVDICDFFRFRDGLVIEFSEYPDSLAMQKLDRGE
jgi:ketosteroid isomerase-like protein